MIVIVNYFLETLTVIFIAYSLIGIVYAQSNNTTAVPQPQPLPAPAKVPNPAVSPPNPTPTAPNPNFQFLPQKAFVYSFAPENGVPSVQPLQPLSSTPTVAGPTVAPAAAPAAGIPGMDIMGILAMVGAGAAYVKGHLGGKKANKAEAIAKETMAAEVDTKLKQAELARVTYQHMPQGGNEIKDAPSIKLQTLNDDAKDLADKAAKT